MQKFYFLQKFCVEVFVLKGAQKWHKTQNGQKNFFKFYEKSVWEPFLIFCMTLQDCKGLQLTQMNNQRTKNNLARRFLGKN